MSDAMTFAQARDRYLNRGVLKSQNTVDAYERAIKLFLEFLDSPDGVFDLPIANQTYPKSEAMPLNALSAGDAPIFSQFASWLQKRGYKESTVRLRIAGIKRWFQFLDDYGWLPAEFPLSKAKRIIRDDFKSSHSAAPKDPPPNIEELIHHYDTLMIPDKLQGEDVDPERVRRWELLRLRNRALMHCLAESGGRISEILSLNVDDFPLRALERREVLRIQVEGKGNHRYHLRFYDALPAVRDYIDARGADFKADKSGKVPLFVNHAPAHAGRRMSRYGAWYAVDTAARARGIGHVSPHDFRHWRATVLLNADYPLDVVQDYLGHRSVETTRAYYAKTDPNRVDAATRDVSIRDTGAGGTHTE
jgi:site-specific recombinase XerD